MTDRNHDLGTLVRLDSGRNAVRYERTYPHPPDRVWHALIEPDSIKAWFPTRIDGLLEAARSKQANAKLRFVFEGEDGPTLEGALRVCEPPRVLEYTWGDELLRFELSATGDSGKHCKLVFTVTFEERAQAPRDATGWHLCLDNLSVILDGGQPVHDHARFPELNAAYSKRLGSDFPNFLKGAPAAELARELPSADLEGQSFRSSSAVNVALVRAARHTEVAHRDLPQGGYIAVIEGVFELHIGGHQMRLGAGMEFQIPAGAHVRGVMEEGTRIVFAAPG